MSWRGRSLQKKWSFVAPAIFALVLHLTSASYDAQNHDVPGDAVVLAEQPHKSVALVQQHDDPRALSGGAASSAGDASAAGHGGGGHGAAHPLHAVLSPVPHCASFGTFVPSPSECLDTARKFGYNAAVLEVIHTCSRSGKAIEPLSQEELPAVKGCYTNVELSPNTGGKWIYKTCGESGNGSNYYGVFSTLCMEPSHHTGAHVAGVYYYAIILFIVILTSGLCSVLQRVRYANVIPHTAYLFLMAIVIAGCMNEASHELPVRQVIISSKLTQVYGAMSCELAAHS